MRAVAFFFSRLLNMIPALRSVTEAASQTAAGGD